MKIKNKTKMGSTHFVLPTIFHCSLLFQEEQRKREKRERIKEMKRKRKRIPFLVLNFSLPSKPLTSCACKLHACLHMFVLAHTSPSQHLPTSWLPCCYPGKSSSVLPSLLIFPMYVCIYTLTWYKTCPGPHTSSNGQALFRLPSLNSCFIQWRRKKIK